MNKEPNWELWARNFAADVETGEGTSFNLPRDLPELLRDAYRAGKIDGRAEQAAATPGRVI